MIGCESCTFLNMLRNSIFKLFYKSACFIETPNLVIPDHKRLKYWADSAQIELVDCGAMLAARQLIDGCPGNSSCL